jgi:subtilisin family serine protease
VSVIVRYRVQPTQVHHDRVAFRGGRHQRNLEILNAAAYAAPASALAELAADPDVEYVALDQQVAATTDSAEPAIHAGTAFQSGCDGRGITVAMIDSGITETHPDLQDANAKSRVVYSQSFSLSESSDTLDRYGHGTHVAAILGGYTNTFRGTAPAGEVREPEGAGPLRRGR